jgi:hypothetical protein
VRAHTVAFETRRETARIRFATLIIQRCVQIGERHDPQFAAGHAVVGAEKYIIPRDSDV